MVIIISHFLVHCWTSVFFFFFCFLSCSVLIQFPATHLTLSSSASPILSLHSRILLVHRLSLMRGTCPAQLHLDFVLCSAFCLFQFFPAFLLHFSLFEFQFLISSLGSEFLDYVLQTVYFKGFSQFDKSCLFQLYASSDFICLVPDQQLSILYTKL